MLLALCRGSLGHLDGFNFFPISSCALPYFFAFNDRFVSCAPFTEGICASTRPIWVAFTSGGGPRGILNFSGQRSRI